MNWYCPACRLTHTTTDPRIETAYHRCPRFAGLTVPFVKAGVAAKLEAHEREDYIGTDKVQTDGNGRPVMSIVTTRDNGQDVTVFAPTAVAQGDGHGLVG